MSHTDAHSTDTPSLLEDRRQIEDVVARYCRAIDRRDFVGVADCYHPGAIDHHAGFTGPVEEFIEWVRTGLTRFGGTHHMLGQQIVEIRGDVARCESYFQAAHWPAPDGEPSIAFTSGSRYIDRMERRDGQWRIAERFAVRDWTRSDEGRHIPAQGAGPRGSAGPEDPLYHLPQW